MSNLLCFGLGYSARVLASRLAAEGWQITGTSRSEPGAAAIRAAGWTGLVFDGTAPAADMVDAVSRATHVLLSVPPDADGELVFRHHAADLEAAPQLRWIGYLSTVGVYGDQRGGVVDENTPPVPGSLRGQRRLTAETAWLAHGRASRQRVQIFRLPGIYGPGRSAVDALQAGTARRIIKPGQVFNRIHVADIATALIAAMAQPGPYDVYNVCDDEPSPPEDVVTYAASLLGIAPPPAVPFETADLTPMARSFYGELKRVSNRRMKAALGVTLAYPTYREGLLNCLGT